MVYDNFELSIRKNDFELLTFGQSHSRPNWSLDYVQSFHNVSFLSNPVNKRTKVKT